MSSLGIGSIMRNGFGILSRGFLNRSFVSHRSFFSLSNNFFSFSSNANNQRFTSFNRRRIFNIIGSGLILGAMAYSMRSKKYQPQLYTSITLYDFSDTDYIERLKKSNIGLELALLSKISDNFDADQSEEELDALKKEMSSFKDHLEKNKIPISKVRVHQPGGYTFYWFSDDNNASGYHVLKQLFSHCHELGFRSFIIHSPYGGLRVNPKEELANYREKLTALVPQDAFLEVEEISTSNKNLKDKESLRFYEGDLFVQLMRDQKSIPLLDSYEAGGCQKTIDRRNDLASQGFEIQSLHLHREKHKFLQPNEIRFLLKFKCFSRFINEGFLTEETSFEEFCRTKSVKCVMPHEEKTGILESYKEVIDNG
ncbi:MAG: hypothetical protein K1060chlam1_01088 [Candidatus Anoxychlamydiales bacterium]|nr:hypothetical protein [Candidatus Anoxychlamydiales bacterium]